MTIDGLHAVDLIETMENFLEAVRPLLDQPSQLDINYVIEGQSIILNEVRPRWDNKDDIREYPMAKATYVRSRNSWKVFWMRANPKWNAYAPEPVVQTLKEFTQLVKEDTHHCFWG